MGFLPGIDQRGRLVFAQGRSHSFYLQSGKFFDPEGFY
jgi:hypothetical protein